MTYYSIATELISRTFTSCVVPARDMLIHDLLLKRIRLQVDACLVPSHMMLVQHIVPAEACQAKLAGQSRIILAHIMLEQHIQPAEAALTS